MTTNDNPPITRDEYLSYVSKQIIFVYVEKGKGVIKDAKICYVPDYTKPKFIGELLQWAAESSLCDDMPECKELHTQLMSWPDRLYEHLQPKVMVID